MFAPVVLAAAALVAQSISVTAGVSAAAERTRFRFENPSSFDSNQLVPHFFEQKYRPPSLETFAEVSYGEASRPALTRVTFRPRKQTRGSDIDTFFQLSGDVVTSGTDGPITYGGFGIEQHLPVATLRGWQVGAMLGYRRDRSEFLPDDRVVTHTQPPSVTRTFITDRETTISQVVAVGALARRERVGDHWRSRLDAGIQPVIGSRLLIRLPDKYPGVDLLYSALSFGSGASWTIERGRRWRAGVTLSASGVWGYRKSATYAARDPSARFFVRSGS